MKLTINVRYVNGEEIAVTPILSDQIAFERTARLRDWGTATDSPLTFAAFLAWKALQRTGKTEYSFEEFLESVETLSQSDGEMGLAPTEATPVE
jgi:hypothetical protein|nr:MAG TPA: hypothetical protein [Caudoviricetes sp.]